MNDLLAVQAFLGNAMLTNPRLALANAVAWLDPSHILARQPHDENEVSDEETGDIANAMYICRRLFPDVYAGATQLAWQGADEPILERFLVDGMNVHLVMKLDALEEIPGGIPVQMLGISFSEDDFFDNYPQLMDILADFGIEPDCTELDIRQAIDLANRLYASFEQQPGATYHQINVLLSWLFASSGNTCIDMTTEEFWESGIELLDWDADNIEEMNAMATEALSILDEAESGLHQLEQDAELRNTFRQNIQKLLTVPSQQGRKKGRPSDGNAYKHQRLCWPERP